MTKERWLTGPLEGKMTFQSAEGTKQVPAYFANSIDCSQKFEQLLVVRVEQLLVGESAICKPGCQISNCKVDDMDQWQYK